MAVHGRDILAEAKCYSTIREAIADCTLVVGTTCRSGLYRSHSQSPREIAPAMVAAARKGKVALIFGPEDHGLSNEDLEHCQLLITIPTASGLSVAERRSGRGDLPVRNLFCLAWHRRRKTTSARRAGKYRAPLRHHARSCSRSAFSTRKIPSICCSRFGGFSDAPVSKRKT